MTAVIASTLAACLAGQPEVTSPSPGTAASTTTSPSPTTPEVVHPSSASASTGRASTVPNPPGDLRRIVTAERDHIRVRLELQRNPLPAGEPSWVKVTVSNRGKNDVTWFHDGCALVAFIRATSVEAQPMGVTHEDHLEKFKTYALGGSTVDAPPAHAALEFVPKANLISGATACADVGISETIKPGKRVQQTLWWSGFTAMHRAWPPAGPIRLDVTAGYYWRGAEPERIPDQTLDLKLDGWISNDVGERLSPAQAVDAALADEAFARYVGTQDIANGRATIDWYDADRNVWEIGVMPWYESDPPRIHGVLVDGTSGTVLGPLDRAWDRKQDPFP